MIQSRNLIGLLIILTAFLACQPTENIKTEAFVKSPNEDIAVCFGVDELGKPYYSVTYKKGTVIDTSYFGFEFKNQPPMDDEFKIIGVQERALDQSWDMVWGEQKTVRNQFREIEVNLQEESETQRKLTVIFRAYDDGVGFRYQFPEQKGVDSLIIMDEHTDFNLTGDHMTWWIPGDWDSYEWLYSTSRFSEIDALERAKRNKDIASIYIPENAVNTPVTMRTDSGLHISFHEAALVDYAGMTLKVDKENQKFTSELVGSERLGYKVKRKLPFDTPWRTIQISEKAGDLIESKLILNLNEPNKLGNIPWFKPMKYVGIWWEMHLGISTWDIEATQDMSTFTKDKATSSKHGATTENAKRYIDFASKNNIEGILVEGWNTGWSHWIGFDDREGVFDFVTPYPDYDIEEVVKYGKEHGVELIMHHETSAAPRTYDQQMDTAYALMQKLGIHSVKSGYVGPIIPKGEYHHGQWMVNHYNNAVIKAADYQVAVNAHEPIKATGLRRTYPNMIAREGLRGQEFNAWASDGGNPPEHLPTVAFTRMLAGPIDFTPGIFNIKLEPYKKGNQVNTTLAQQLALYVVIYSPIQMAADLPESYEGQPAFQFIRDVAVDWDRTEVLNGEVGDFVTIARKAKGSNDWYLGSISDENERDIKIEFSFLDEGKTYEAIIYKDGEDAHWNDNPESIVISNMDVTNTSSETFHLAPGGGLAISIKPKQ
ncbi:glycoside hydrolase family 97 protein [Marinigracilibium pacificum]|uniref:Glycoside hydrolase family 97 protein n=1 Tax=Marinigracilibium pacificum TaxID=2729599 RepID=A0A848J5N7_9BACT|nr:glycoside hydrolase family 97 protein [Marinigracilibium pacificum]NMM48442.1 glycoside hydrolase family 97 protein [Marinigracilibium pacificum]